MEKVCLTFVLTAIFVFNATAQTITKYSNQPDAVNNAQTADVSIAGNKTEASNAPENDVEVENLDFQKTQINLLTDASSIAGIAISAGKTLGAFSTGNIVFDKYILDACERHDVDPLLIYAQMSQESSFRKKAVSHKGASGLMQLMPDTAARFGVRNIYDPRQNIEAGVKYMRWLLDEFGGDVRLALAGYNAGEGAVKKHGNKVPPYRETRSYVDKITAHYDKIKL